MGKYSLELWVLILNKSVGGWHKTDKIYILPSSVNAQYYQFSISYNQCDLVYLASVTSSFIITFLSSKYVQPKYLWLLLKLGYLKSVCCIILPLAGCRHRMPTHIYCSVCQLRYKHVIYIETIPSRRTSKLFSCIMGWENKLVSCGARNPFILCFLLAPHARISCRSWWGAWDYPRHYSLPYFLPILPHTAF